MSLRERPQGMAQLLVVEQHPDICEGRYAVIDTWAVHDVAVSAAFKVAATGALLDGMTRLAAWLRHLRHNER